MNKTFNIAKNFTTTPGYGTKQESDFSGEQLRKEYIIPILKDCDKLTIILDEAYGYSCSFLYEAFGKLTKEQFNKIEFVSEEDPFLINEIMIYHKGESFDG